MRRRQSHFERKVLAAIGPRRAANNVDERGTLSTVQHCALTGCNFRQRPVSPFNLQRFSALLRWSLAIYRHRQRAEGWHQMDTLLIVGGVLLIAVVGRSLLDPWPCATSEHQKKPSCSIE